MTKSSSTLVGQSHTYRMEPTTRSKPLSKLGFPVAWSSCSLTPRHLYRHPLCVLLATSLQAMICRHKSSSTVDHCQPSSLFLAPPRMGSVRKHAGPSQMSQLEMLLRFKLLSTHTLFLLSFNYCPTETSRHERRLAGPYRMQLQVGCLGRSRSAI